MNPHWEDWILLGSTICGAIGTALTTDPKWAVLGLVIGSIGKALPSLRSTAPPSPKA